MLAWINHITLPKRRGTSTVGVRSSKPALGKFRPGVEVLEDRLVLDAMVVSSTALAAAPNPSVVGQSVTFTATVTPIGSGFGIPTGTVAFTEGGTTLGTGALLTNGTATFTTKALALGANSVTATYSGDAHFTASTSAAVTQTVNMAPTTTTLNAFSSPFGSGQAITLFALVSVTAPGFGEPTGTVTFMDNGTKLGTATVMLGVDTPGTVTANITTSLLVGSNSLTAVYAGDTNFSSSTSAPVVQMVAATTTTLTSMPNQGVLLTPGTLVTFTATVTPTGSGGTPTGTVTFMDNGSPIGTAMLNNGVASFAAPLQTVGTHTVTAVYSGDADFATSTSNALTFSVGDGNSSGTATTFVEQLYADLLHRQADPGGLAFWVNVASSTGPTNVVVGIEQSAEFRTDEVQFVYEKFLRRAPDPTGLAVWTSFLNHGATFQQLEASILGSDEYFQRFGSSNNSGFLNQLYKDTLGRPADSNGLNAWGNILAQIPNPRPQVAFAILQSPESITDEVASYYQQFLGRSADSGGLATFVADRESGATSEQAVASILASQEYFARSSGTLGTPFSAFFTPSNLAAGAPGAPAPAGFLFV